MTYPALQNFACCTYIYRMLHNTLYRFQRNQKKTLLFLGLLFLTLSAIWWYAEIVKWQFPMEPPVVFVGGLTTLLAIYWPFKSRNTDKRKKGRIKFDCNTNNGEFKIGQAETEFTLKFSSSSETSVHVYNYPSDIKRVALASSVGQISDIKDVSVFDYTNTSVTPHESQIVCLENHHGNFACVHIHDVRYARNGDDFFEVTFSFVIIPGGDTDFS